MVWQNIKGLELDEKLNQLNKGQLDLYNFYQELLIDYEELRNTNKISSWARENLSMMETSKKDFILLGIKEKEKLINKFLNKEGLEN